MKIDSYFLFKLRSILKFGIFSLIVFFIMIQFFLSTGYTFPKALFSFLYGMSIGVVYMATSSTRFYSRSFFTRNLLRVVLLFISVGSIIVFEQFFFSDFLNPGAISREINLFSIHFMELFILILIITFLIVLFIEFEKLLGNNFIWNFILSKYKRPVDEDKVVMFLDLKDSTTIAEKIGNKEFVSFINLCYQMMTHSVIKNKATILKYVGDEVILTWDTPKGINDSNSIRFYFDFVDELEAHKSVFLNRFGFFPIFKAGVHSGVVTAAFLGTIKKQMDYSGDVMNTTARIQSICNEFHAEILVSKYLSDLLPSDKNFKYIELGEVDLKGKEHKFPIVQVERIV